MRISVIIPALNEESSISAAIESIIPLQPHEIIVVDGDSTDRTVAICRELGICVLSSPRGRARQMNLGAQHATGDALLFLHADTQLPCSALDDIRRALADPRIVGGRFDVRLDGKHWMLKLIGVMISLRSRVSKVATGDQGIFVRRAVFAELGGYPDLPLMEDVALARALRRRGSVALLRSRVVTSARRWEAEGVWRTIFKMWWLKALYLLGVSPLRLKRYYGDAR
jgi:rSAM/selenodomain-associated transferase 2